MSTDQEIAHNVAKYGWYAISVSDNPPSFTYTCGLMTTFQHPEAIIFGLESGQAYEILRVIVADLRAGKSFGSPGLYDGVLEKMPIAIRRVHRTQHELYLGYAMGHRRYVGRMGDLKAIQVFWPDK